MLIEQPRHLFEVQLPAHQLSLDMFAVDTALHHEIIKALRLNNFQATMCLMAEM